MSLDSWKFAIGIIVAAFVNRSQAQRWITQVNYSMCGWGQARVNTIRDTVYLEGGNFWNMIGYDDGSVDFSSSDSIHYLNLSSSFNTATINLTTLLRSMPNSAGPIYVDGVMFANDYMFYSYGGLDSIADDSTSSPADAIRVYERYPQEDDDSSWKPGFVDNINLDGITRYVTNGAGVSSPSENMGFYVSGMRAPDWGPIWDNETATNISDQMITVHMDRESPTWSNITLPDHVLGRANAEAVWIPVSESGAVVLIGRVTQLESLYYEGLSSDQVAESTRDSPAFMETVSIYDVASNTWYNQNTTGNIPPQLTQFCSVYASAFDGSSHNIYIYGGYDGLSRYAQPLDNVYVLSLPSFEWILLYSGGGQVHGRKEHSCIRPLPDQMLVLGGTDLDNTTCIEMIKVFNLNTGRFQDMYDTATWNAYQVPALVYGRIGGDSAGGATRTSPVSWMNTSLRDVFASPYARPIATWYPDRDTTNATTTTSSDNGSNPSSFPSWAGGLIDALLGLAVIASLLAVWLVRRRKRITSQQQSKPLSMLDLSVPAEAASSEIAHEAGSEPRYEMQVQEQAAELPTQYNVNALLATPSNLEGSRTGNHPALG